uniref:Uncharacterized protein n=1 Tax=Strongyloides venezuelensis TaxID=75913 RepID=A0A0K0G6A5_STRVS
MPSRFHWKVEQSHTGENSGETIALVHSNLDIRTFKSSLSNDSTFEDIRYYKNSVIMKSSLSSGFLPKSERTVASSIRFKNAISSGLANLKGLTSLYNKLIKDEIIPYSCKIPYVPTDIYVNELISSKIKCKRFVETTVHRKFFLSKLIQFT